ncbi:MAG: PQQ-dependent sugar dehydrogenase [Fimbriiglobus sp.]|nr:PQQ-dependent sugar dehydrogenase [Fimbriiglobus sp.]
MNRLACLIAALLPLAALAADPPTPSVVVKGLSDLRSLHITPDGRTFVGVGRDTKGQILEVKDGATKVVAAVTDPLAITSFQGMLYVTSGTNVVRLDPATGKSSVWVSAADFPEKIELVNRLCTDERGTLYVGAVGNPSKVYRVSVKPGMRGQPPARPAVTPLGNGTKAIQAGGALLTDGLNHLLTPMLGKLNRVRMADGDEEEVANGFKSASDLCVDTHGRLFVADTTAVWGLPRPGERPIKVWDRPGNVFDQIAYHPLTRSLVLADLTHGVVYSHPAQIPGWEVDESPLPVEAVPAFADVKWTGWDDGSESGRSTPLRPLVLTHAGDGSGRTFMATQQGVIHIIEKGAKQSKVFLDLQNKVLYKDNENEQGLLGLAFHPDYKKTGEFFVFYTDKAKKLENVLCRFKVSKDDPNRADPASEQELLRVSHKYWNHDGGTVAFGPDGFLYLVLGDGGSANDPDDHGQKTDTLLGKILRLDVNAKGDTTPYAIPKDNPFVGKAGYRPEVFASGVRNPWRMSFDRKTGQGWFGDVGQNLWEEINLLSKGANYGWRRREGFHPFGADGNGPKPEFTDPIWEYHHDVGKSITAGHVYRGKEVPGLDGHFLYADYVSGKVWGLKYDEKAKRVTANRPIATPGLPWMTFGEDEAGEVYVMTYSATGKGIYKFAAKK